VNFFFDSKKVTDEVLKSGRLFAAGGREQVVEVDLNLEVRRCFIFRSSNSTNGHENLFFDSKRVSDEVPLLPLPTLGPASTTSCQAIARGLLLAAWQLPLTAAR
jgi:hypothetical protein